MKLFAKIRSRLSAEPLKRTVRFDDERFEVLLKEEVVARVHWASVTEVAAFKRDLFSIDEICFGFCCEGTESFWRVGEEDIGFAAFEAQIEKRFPGIRTDWFREVAVPAFRDNWTTLWRKSESSLPA
jgi:hypothetical protein